jgi:hypothetical protein
MRGGARLPWVRLGYVWQLGYVCRFCVVDVWLVLVGWLVHRRASMTGGSVGQGSSGSLHAAFCHSWYSYWPTLSSQLSTGVPLRPLVALQTNCLLVAACLPCCCWHVIAWLACWLADVPACLLECCAPLPLLQPCLAVLQ